MENLTIHPNLAGGDLLELSPMKLPNSILKASQKENLIMLQTPVHKHLKVGFITPKRTPLQPIKVDTNISESVLLETTQRVLSTPSQIQSLPQKLIAGSETPKTRMPSLRKGVTPRRVAVSSDDMLEVAQKITSNDTLVANSSTVRPAQIPQKIANAESKTTKWDSLRKLDETLHWRERVEVITKLDHQEYIECARECILQLIDKAVDISVPKQGSRGLNSTTTVSKVMTPMSDQYTGIISPIVAKTTSITRTAEILTPISSSINGTFEVSTSESFLSENMAKDLFQLNQSRLETAKLPVNDENACFKTTSGVIKPVNMCPRNSSQITPRSRSMSDNYHPGGGNGDVKNAFTIGPRSFSYDLDNIPEDIDIDLFPAKLSNTGNFNTTPLSEVYNQSVNASYDISVDQSVFMTPEARPFVMRPIDLAFGNEEFVDSAKLLEQGQLDLDYLDKKTTGAISQDLRKQSLYVKFDPLLEGLGNRTSIVVLGRKSDIIDFTGRVTPVPEPTEEDNISPREPDLLCDSPSQIGCETTFDCSQLPMRSTSSNGDSVSSSSPCPQSASATKPDTGIIEVLKYSEDDIQRILNRKKEKWAKERDASTTRYQELKENLQNQEILLKDYEEKCKQNGRTVCEEKEQYEREIAALQKDKKRIDSQILTLTQTNRVLFQRTDKLQKNLSNLQANELKQIEHMKASREKCSASKKKILDIEMETAAAGKNIVAEKNEFEVNIAGQLSGLQFKIKATEFKLKGLQATLDHKKNENKELMKICDELVASDEVQ